MARVTVEDCVLRIPNRFELVAMAAQRARDISAGAELTIDRDRDKNPVVALREIADGTVSVDELHEALIQGLQKHVEADPADEAAETFEIETFAPELAGVGEPGVEAAAEGEEAAEGDLDLESLARELAAEADGFKGRDED